MAIKQESDVRPVNLEDDGDNDSVNENTLHTLFDIPSEKNMVKKKRRLVSEIWKEFRMLTCEPGQPLYCECNKCGKKYLADSKYGTGNLHRHLKSCTKKTISDVEQFLVSSDKEVLTTSFNQDKFRELLVHEVISHDLPFSCVEYEDIRDIFKCLEPQVVNISRNDVKSDILKMYENEMIRIRGELAACPGRICLTFNAWSSMTTDEYLSLSAHFVDSNWVLQKRTLNFSLFPPPHGGTALSDKILTLVNGWGIEEKLFSITFDDTSTINSCVGNLEDNLLSNNSLMLDGILFHVRCFAHILNLIVQEGLKEMDDVVSKIRECVKYVKGSSETKVMFDQCLRQTSLGNDKGLQQDVPTLWNSTYIMLSGAIYYRLAFHNLHLADSSFESCPSQEEWERVSKICELLEVFYNAINSFSGFRYPTSNMYSLEVFLVQLKLVEKCKSSDTYMKKIAEQMFFKFNKYWSNYNILLAIAIVFDPRFNFKFLEFSYGKLHGCGSKELSTIKGTLVRLFDEYMKASNMVTDFSLCSEGSDDGHVVQECEKDNKLSMLFEEFEQFKSNKVDDNTQKTELELYLAEPTINRKTSFDVLEFWRLQQFRYPVLSKLARDVLCVPISTVTSDSAFSLDGRILDEYRSLMSPTVVEALVCVKDWLFGEPVVSHVKLDEILQNVLASDGNDDEINSMVFQATSSNVL